jgi:L-lactate dehydrogenase complex protein LldG
VGETIQAQVVLFAKQSEILKTQFIECNGIEEVASRLTEIGRENAWKKVAWHSGECTTPMVDAAVRGGTQWEWVRIESGYDPDSVEACDAGVTECEVLVAQTGSVMVSARSSGGRALSVLPHHHVVVARRIQLVADLAEAYERVERRYGGQLPSFLSFISGPSRTGDIERILVLGAHGPKKLTVLLLSEP